MIYWPTRDPDASLVYGIDWSPTLAKLGDANIIASEWTVQQGSAVLSDTTFSNKTASVRVSGGVEGEETVLKNVVFLSIGGSITEYTFQKVEAEF